MTLIYPKAEERITGQFGGYMVGGPPRGIIHTTETSHRWGFFTSKTFYTMQFLYDPSAKGGVRIGQFIDLNLASRALYNGPHSVQTNRMGSACPNIVIVGYAKDSPNLPREVIGAIAEFIVWDEEKQKVPSIFPLQFQGGEAYGTGGVGRLSISQWQKFTGWGGHQDVPDGNTHWDPGRIPVVEFRKAIEALKGAPMATITYKGVINVPEDPNNPNKPVSWVADVIDHNITRGIIKNEDDHVDDWAKDGRLWIFFDRMLEPIEAELEDKDAKIKALTRKVNDLQTGSGGDGLQYGDLTILGRP